MKTTTKRFLSVLLTVFMIFGTVAMMIPAAVITASAAEYQTITVNGVEQQLPYTLENNTDQLINGVKYRFDTGSENGSYAKILANGTIQLNMVQGDLFWIPTLGIQESSTVNVTVELTATPQTGNVSAGLAYDISEWNSSDDKIMVAGFASNNRTRVGIASVSGTQKANAGLDDHYCANNNTSGKKGDWANSTWSVGETRKIKLYYSGSEYSFDFCTDGGTVKTTRSYGSGSIKNGLGYFDGAIGFLMIYSDGNAYDTAHHLFTLKNMEATDLSSGGDGDGNFDLNETLVSSLETTVVGNPNTYITVNGQVKSLPYTLESNTDQVINGVTYRFDTGAETESYAKILADGTIELYMVQGDLFWIPSLEIQQSSTVFLTAELTASPQIGNICAGLAYGITEWDSSDDLLVAAAFASGKRTRVSVYSIASSRKNDGGSVADYCGNNSSNQTFTNNSWDNGETRNIKLYYSSGANEPYAFDFYESGTVRRTRSFGSGAITQSVGEFTDSVGFFMGYSGNHSSGLYYEQYHKFTLKNIEATNLASGGDAGGSFNMKSSIKNGFAPVGAVSDVAASLSLDGTIGFNFKFKASSYAETHGKLVVTKNGTEILNESFVNLWDSEEKACVYSVPMAAKEMTDTVTFKIYIDDEIYGGHSYTTSVKSYAEALAAEDAEWEDLMNAMLDYGAAAQQLFDYNTGNLAVDISSGGITYDASSDPSLSADVAYNAFISRVAGTLTLESGTDLNLYVLPVDGEATFTASAMSNSASVPVTVTKNGDYWRITISNLKAEELGAPFYITVSDGTHSVTFTYSALCWVKAAINDANASANTKTLAKAIGVYASEAQKKNNYSVISLAGQIAGAGAVSALRSATDSRISSIRSSTNGNNLIWTGSDVRNYYVSSSTGSNSNSGTDESHPWKTLGKVNEVLYSANGSSTYKYNIYLKRGDIWRGEFLKTYKTSNVTITTYGSGAKPIITGSPENGANASKWTQVATNIWRYTGSDSWEDVGNIVFNDGECYGCKVVQLYVKNTADGAYRITNFSDPADCQKYSFTSYTDLRNDLDFYHDKDFDGGSGATGYLYLYSTSNPGSRFSSIEFSVKQHGIEIYKADNVRVDNVCVKYVGGHGIAGNGLNLQNILIQNCEFDWIGGSLSDRISNSVIGTVAVTYDLRYGNAVEIYGGCNNFRVQNNYIYQVYDAGITQQYNCESKTDSNHTANQLNIYYHNNVIENCNYSIEYFLSKCPTSNTSYIDNFQITDNIMWNAGKGFCETRGQWGLGFAAHIKAQSGSTSCNRFANSENAFVISGNKFIGQRDAVFAICSKMSASNANANPVVTNNEFYGIYQTNKIGAIANYDSGSDVQIHNVYAPYDTNIQTYMNGAIGASKFSGNTIKFLF